MGLHWFFFAACATCLIFHGCCLAPSAQEDVELKEESNSLGTLFGFKPCLDEMCDRYDSYLPEYEEAYEYETQGDQAEDVQFDDQLVVHCFSLKQNAIEAFQDLETRCPGVSVVKKEVFEEIIQHMQPLLSIANVGKCSAKMRLASLIALAATTLKSRYMLQGDRPCTYHSFINRMGSIAESRSGIIVPPCNSGSRFPCPVKPSRPCPEGSTTEHPCRSTTTPKPTQRPCPEGATTEHPCRSTTTPKPAKRPCPEGATTEHPCRSTTTPKPPKRPCPEGATTERPCETLELPESELYPPFVGSLRGVPGFNYPDYTDIPITSFSCDDKEYVPGFYADLDTGCQVFHVCFENRRESFLCPVGTTFNQPILACDYWYSSNCSLAPLYYAVNDKTADFKDYITEDVDDIISIIVDSELSISEETDLDSIAKFLPVKAKVEDIQPVEVPKGKFKKPHSGDVEGVASMIFDKIVSTATKVASETSKVVERIPEPVIWEDRKPVIKMEPMKLDKLLPKTIVPIAKAKLAAAIPAVKTASAAVKFPAVHASKFAAKTKMTLPVIAAATKSKLKVPVKGKVLASVAAKTKLAAAAPKVASKASIPLLKSKAALPFAKVAAPALKGKILKSGAPLLKAKMFSPAAKLAGAVPLGKIKLAKAAAISPLTKKALAVGYIKLLKAKKLKMG